MKHIRISAGNRNKSIFVAAVLLLVTVQTGCADRSAPFDQKGWNAWDGHYYARKFMVDDLMNNHLKAGMTCREVVALLGESYDANETDTLPSIRYEIDVEYEFCDIDPCAGKDLFIQFDKDSTVVAYQVIDWKSGSAHRIECAVNSPYILTQRGPVEVDDLLERGYKIIGRYKLSNPHPRPITSADAGFIARKLSDFLKTAYPGKTFRHALQEPTGSLDMEYAFTLLSYKRILEGDFYRLKLEADDKESVTLYIAKAMVDNETYDDTEECVVYPFFTEAWHKTIEDPNPYKPGEFW